jgi:hypothetical protein
MKDPAVLWLILTTMNSAGLSGERIDQNINDTSLNIVLYPTKAVIFSV